MSTYPRSIEARLNVRARCARWAAKHRHVTRQNPWLAGAPPFGTHLRGGAMPIALDPVPQWPIALRNTRALHGLLTSVSARPHLPHEPRWSLVPWQSGWAVYWYDDDLAQAIALTSHEGVLFDRPTRVTFGSLVRFRAPQVPKRGRQRVRIDAITPVSMACEGRDRPITCPAASHLAHALDGMLLQRIAPSPAWRDYVRARIRLEMVERSTEPAHVPLGGKYGTVAGWTGHVVVEVNAVSRWLLGVVERAGMGGRVAFGFGRIRLSEVP